MQNILGLCGAIVLLFLILGKYIYRLTFHPLSKFPGPTLAAATSLYGAFYDLGPNTSYVKSFPDLHKKYGPVVRAWPNHLHFAELQAFNEIFKIGSKYDKHAPFYSNPALSGGFSLEPNRKTALPRRAIYAQEFNRDAVRRAEPRIAHCVSKFIDKLDCYAQTGRPVNMTDALMCLMVDGVTNFMYQEPYGALDADNFKSNILVPVHDFTKMTQWPGYFPRVFGLVFNMTSKLPVWVLERWFKGFVTQKDCLEMCQKQIDHVRFCPSGEARPRTIFDTTLKPNLEKGQKIQPIGNLTADAFTFVMAGTDTSSHTLVVALYNLLDSRPDVLQALKQELRTKIRDRKSSIEWASLEKLPYLRAVIKESLRLSLGAPGRLPRVVPKGGAVLGGQRIPAGTIVSSSIYMHNMNSLVFPDPDRFQPERWLNDAPKLEQYLCSFSRGSRGCLGMNLAYCELYIILARLLRWYDLQLFETSKEDMEWKDSLVPMTKGPLKVLLKGIPE